MRHGKLVALLGLWGAVTGAMAAMPGCYGRNCDGTSGGYGNKPGEGRMIDENTWESTPMDGKWLHFSSGHAWFFEVPALGERVPYSIETYISPIEEPNVFGPGQKVANFTMAGGNLAELSGVGPGRFVVRNGSCAEYFMRVVVEVPPKADTPVPVAVDASLDASDAGITDADVESGADTGADDGATDAGTD